MSEESEVSMYCAEMHRQKIINEVSERIKIWLVDPYFYNDGDAFPDAYIDHALRELKAKILEEYYGE